MFSRLSWKKKTKTKKTKQMMKKTKTKKKTTTLLDHPLCRKLPAIL